MDTFSEPPADRPPPDSPASPPAVSLWQIGYWLLPALLTGAQLPYTLAAMNQIHFDELNASITAPYWFSQQEVFASHYSNVGWYALLVMVYNVFGFALNTARWVRLAIQLISLFCLASLAKRLIGRVRGALLLLVVGLSPTLLHFNTLQTENGLDVQLLPIALWLLFGVAFTRKREDMMRLALFWAVSMSGCMCYPAFLMYLPALVVGCWQLHTHAKRTGSADMLSERSAVLISISAFAAPLLAVVVYLRRPARLFYDPETGHGLFRGAGRFQPGLASSLASARRIMADLFSKGDSYLFWYDKVEFRPVLGVLGAGGVLVLAVLLFLRYRPSRLILALISMTAALSLGLSSVDSYLPGLRRATPLLASFYMALAALWWAEKHLESHRARLALGLATALLFASHSLAWPGNLAHTGKLSTFRDQGWFALQGLGPAESFGRVRAHIQGGGFLGLRDQTTGTYRQVRYYQIYAALAGDALWNEGQLIEVRAYHQEEDKVIPLDIHSWEKKVFPY